MMHGGYYAIVRLCLATLIAFKSELMNCEFDTCLIFLQQHLWVSKNVTKRIIESLLKLTFRQDKQLEILENEYATGVDSNNNSKNSSSSNNNNYDRKEDMKRNANKKNLTEKLKEKDNSTSTIGVGVQVAVVATTLLAGLGAMLFMGGGESSSSARSTNSGNGSDNRSRETKSFSRQKDEL